MGSLYLVRHGQASFGAADYDQLSPLGYQQCVRLGQYFTRKGMRFDAIVAGTLRRHRQSLAGILEGMGLQAEHLAWPGLNEYDGPALLATVHSGPLTKPETPEAYRQHFRLLREALLRWMEGQTQPEGMPSYAQFVGGVVGALDHVRTHHVGQQVLMVSSGGPISTAVGQVLGSPAAVTIDLNMRMRNSAITEFAVTPKRHMLVGYNALPHLEDAPDGSWVTHA